MYICTCRYMYAYVAVIVLQLRLNTLCFEWFHCIDAYRLGWLAISHLVRDLLVLLQEHVQLTDADPQVTVSELVGNVEPQSSKLPPLQSHAMEEAE